MSIIGGLALALIIIALGGYAGKRVVDGVAEGIAGRMSGPARKKAAKAGSKARATVIEPVRHIKARAMADVRAQHWLEKKQAARKRREARREARPPRNWRPRLPRVAVHIPGVTDLPAQPKGTGPQPSPARPPLTAVPAASPAPSRPVSPATPTTPGRPSAMPASRNGVPPDHASVNARVAQYEPESDGDLIRFMEAEAAAMASYAHSLEELFDHLLNGVGLDPASIQGVTEFANANAEAAAIMAKASAQLQRVYQGVREDVSKGTVLPFRGRWITGESA